MTLSHTDAASSSETATRRWPSKSGEGSPWLWECGIVAAYLFAFVAAATAIVSHGRQHADAVMDAEIAVNVIKGTGAVTFSHPQTIPGSQLPDASPVYSRMLSAWLRCFGVSSDAVMSMNVTIVAGTVFLLWLFLVRSDLVRNSWLRILFVVCLPLITPVATIYRINRYDPYGMLGLAAASAALTISRRDIRLAVLAVAGLLIGTAGFHVVIGGGLLTAIALMVVGTRYLPEFLAVNIGVAGGLGLVIANIISLGMFGATQRVLEQNAVGAARSLSWYLLAPLRGGQLTSIVDADLLLLGTFAMAAIGSARMAAVPRLAKPVVFGLMAAVCIPLTLAGFGRYSDTYVWLTAVPVLTCCFMSLDRHVSSRFWAGCITTLVLLTALIGFPAHAFMLAAEWQAQDRDPTDAWIESHLQADDVGYTSIIGYYPVKRKLQTAYIGSAFHSMTADQRAGVTVLIMDGYENGRAMFEPDADDAIASFGGDWDLVAELRTPRGELRKKMLPQPKRDCTYHVMIYRKRLPERE